MNLKRTHKMITSGRLTVPLVILFSAGMRLFYGVGFNEYIVWINFAIQTAVAFLLLKINHDYTIISKKTFLPFLFFMLFFAADVDSYADLYGNISVVLMALCLGQAFKTYQDADSHLESQAFSYNIAFILTAGSILCWSPLVLFIPVFWVGFYYFKSLNFRSFFASVFGILTVYLFLSVWAIYNQDWSIFLDKIFQFELYQPVWIDFSWYEWMIWGVVLFLIIISGINIFISGFSERIRTWKFLQFLFLMAVVCIVAMCVFQLLFPVVHLILYIPFALIIGHYFTLSESKWGVYLFLLTVVFYLTYYIAQCLDPM